MFTCNFEKQCKQAEEEARKKHFGQATGLKYLFKKLTWIPWVRDNCSYSCSRNMMFRLSSYDKTLQSDTFKGFMKRTSKHESGSK